MGKFEKYNDFKSKDGYSLSVYKFPNGYGAYVNYSETSILDNCDLYKLAVLKFVGKYEYEFSFDTSITGDFIFDLRKEQVDEYLQKIFDLEQL